jgi:alanine dehydrogenase
MKIGVPKEVKVEEYRVGLSPNSARELINLGHQVFVERGAGLGINFLDSDYRKVGVTILDTAEEIFAEAEMIVKVKEPQASEYGLLKEGQILFTYLHLAPDPVQAEALINSGCIAIAYETVTASDGTLPLLAPMSQVAGRLSIQVGAHCLEKNAGGSGILLGGVPGVYAGKVAVIGGGVVGINAVRMALGKGSEVTVLDKSLNRLQELDLQFNGRLNTAYSTHAAIEEHVSQADLVIGAVLVPGKSAPKLVTKSMLKLMKPGSVIVDVAIDQGGSIETSHATTHVDPTYVVDDIVHYCVANMPGAVPRTSTLALNNATLPFVVTLAQKGWKLALKEDEHLRNGLNVCFGQVTHPGVAVELEKPCQQALEAIAHHAQ